MKVKDIKDLPDEFSFRSRYGIGDIVYHARKRKFDYEIRWEGGYTTMGLHDVRVKLMENEFIVVD